MKHLLVATITAALFSWPNRVGQAPVTLAETQRAAAIARRDAAFYDQLAADDLLVVNRDGALRTKTERLIGVMSGEGELATRGERDIDVRRYGDLAIVIGRSEWMDGDRSREETFSRIWVRQRDQWRLVATHITDVTPGIVPGEFDASQREVPTLPIADSAPMDPSAEDQVRQAIAGQHAAYWSKDADAYRRYAGPDLLRIAETGIRPREELIRMMRGNARLPAAPSEQRDVRVRLYGNAAVTTWLDVGRGAIGDRREAQNRFTVVLVRRPIGWQMVHIQSTGARAGG